jgi:hypothetical protein
MRLRLAKMTLFASFAWIAALVLTQGTLRAADTIVYAIRIGTQTLGTLDLNTGVFTQISAQAISESQLGVFGGVLYGAGGCGCLIQINPTTGAVTAATTPFSHGGNNFGALNGFGSTTNGLFAIGAGAGGLNGLYSIDPTTGLETLIGSTGITAGGGTGFLSASNDSTKLFWEVQTNTIDSLYSINTSTGAATLIGAEDESFPKMTGNPYSMVFTGGTLWANFYSLGFGTIDTTNGHQNLVSTGAINAFFGMAPFPLASPPPLFVGSMGHIAAEGNWTTTFTLVNKGGTTAQAQLSFFGDASNPTGNGPLSLPLVFSQPGVDPLVTASYGQALAANASVIITTGGPQIPNGQTLTGSAQLGGSGAIDGFAIFHQIAPAQEAVVPMETRNANSYLLAFDNTNGVGIGVAVANVSAQSGNIGVIIRDDSGNQIGSGTLPMAGNGHMSFILSTQFSVTANKRGTVEFDTPSGGQISVLGIRFTQPKNALTTIPALANVGTGGGSIAHIASGNGWQTTFVLVNTGTTAAQIHLKFFADGSGAPLALPVSFPQPAGGPDTVTTSVDQTLAAGASLLVVSAAPVLGPVTVGSAQLTTNGNVGGFVIFRNNTFAQEAVVPLETRNANGYILAFDNTGGKAAGIAINSVSSQSVNVPVVVRDESGNQIASDTLTLAANAHLSFVLGDQSTDKYSATANKRGTIEFDTPPGGQIGVVGIRANGQAFTTLPALVK